jgi:ParB family chromosome partitioning protein
VDGKKLGFSQGVDISFLAEEAQQWVQAVMEEKGCNVSMVQSAKIKEYPLLSSRFQKSLDFWKCA